MNELIKKAIAACLLLLGYSFGFSQENIFVLKGDSSVFSRLDLSGWATFRKDKPLRADDIFTSHKAAFCLSKPYEMRLKRKQSDTYGMEHYFYDEYYNGLPIKGGEYALHEKNGKIIKGNGKIYTSPNPINTNFTFDDKTAIRLAIQATGALRFYWQDSLRQKRIREKQKNPAATYYPTKAERMIYVNRVNYAFTTVYRVFVPCFDFGKSGYYYINSRDGSLAAFETTEMNCNQSVTPTPWYGNQLLWTTQHMLSSDYYLEDDCGGKNYAVYFQDGTAYTQTHNVQWINNIGATTLSVVRTIYDIYYTKFGRLGFDDANRNLEIYTPYTFPGGSTNNAAFSYLPVIDDELLVGEGSPGIETDNFCTNDILGHEFTHGVNKYQCGLAYQGESGALDESFADCMGEYIEHFANIAGRGIAGRSTCDWFVGAERTDGNNNPLPLRSFANPMSVGNPGQPDRYQGTNWLNPSCGTPTGPPNGNDFCGVHRNSGVQNRMFYLLSQGGSGWTNALTSSAVDGSQPNSYQWSVNGIGISNAGQIAYRALCLYMSTNSTYVDSKNAWVQAAVDIFGECSSQAISTGKAWYAVGLPPPVIISPTNVCGTYGSTAVSIFKGGVLNVANGCPVTITTSNPVLFRSSDYIKFFPGFRAVANGSYFIASIDQGCRFASN